jgi:uncharacterized iron-regulated membrane protein
MTVRQALLVTHRWLGLGSSVVLAAVGLTGAVMVFGTTGLVARIAGRIHETLALGAIGSAVVIAATVGAVLLQCSGIVLWWKRKSVAIRWRRGWAAALIDIHYAAGILALILMTLLAVTALGMTWLPPGPDSWRRLCVELHSARSFPAPIKLVYAAGSLGFLVQGVTGVGMWWKKP